MTDLSSLTCTSRDGCLSIYTYDTCSNDSPSDLKASRGLIVENRDTVLWQTFGYVDEYIESLPANLDISEYSVYPAREGTCLRLFYYDDKWFLSTHRKLNAFKSFWGSEKSFGQLFVDALMDGYGKQYDEFLSRLNPEQLYVFFMTCTKENRIACNTGPYPELYHVATFSQEGLVDSNIGIRKQAKIDVHDVLDYVKNVDPRMFQGLLLRNGTHEIKITSAKYKKFVALRNNQPSLVQRYLEIRTDCTVYKDFMELYFDQHALFADIEKDIQVATWKLVPDYRKRYEEGLYVHLSTTEHIVLKNVYARIKNEPMPDDTALHHHLLFEISNLDAKYIRKLL